MCVCGGGGGRVNDLPLLYTAGLVCCRYSLCVYGGGGGGGGNVSSRRVNDLPLLYTAGLVCCRYSLCVYGGGGGGGGGGNVSSRRVNDLPLLYTAGLVCCSLGHCHHWKYQIYFIYQHIIFHSLLCSLYKESWEISPIINCILERNKISPQRTCGWVWHVLIIHQCRVNILC